MGNLPAKVTGRYQSYDINTPRHVTPPMTIRRNNNENSNNNNSNNSFHHFQQQQLQHQQQQKEYDHEYIEREQHEEQQEIAKTVVSSEALTLPNPNRVAATTYMQENDDDVSTS